MKRAISALMLCLLLSSPAFSGEGPDKIPDKIKVLVLDSEFTAEPGNEEQMELMDRTNGDLIIESTTYRGNLEVWRSPNGLYLINELPFEKYVEGVVKAETGDDWAFEALKAQAVIVRTYLQYQLMNRKTERYSITSSVLHQLYKGLNSDSLVSRAVRETKGEVLTYDGKPIIAYYHSTSGGTTEVPEAVFGRKYPYLTSVKTDCTLSPMCIWARRIPLETLGKATGTKGITEIKVASYTPTGRVGTLEIVANPETVTVRATDLRRMLGWSKLPSTDFSFYLEDNTMIIEGKGYGHGVGLCQWSALEMAIEGKDYQEILAFFYPGATLERYEAKKF